MPPLPTVQPQRIGILPDRLARVSQYLDAATQSGELPSATLCIGRRGAIAPPMAFRCDPDTPFLAASLSKPVTAAAILLLIERGQLGLEDTAASYIPEFADRNKDRIRVRHLLTHTSGLPDQLPNNADLRAAHSPLSAFVEGTCHFPPLFDPGTQVSYQSMGFTILGEILNRITGQGLPEFAKAELFEPLGMSHTAFGYPPDSLAQVAPIRLTPEQAATDWNWNSPYWLTLGAPWGGLITTATDYARFCRMILDEGTVGKHQLLAPLTIRAMTRNQLHLMPDVPDPDRRGRPWGLGWRLNGPAHEPAHGDLLSPNAFDHWGATGCLTWIDPEADALCVILTTKPVDEDHGRLLARASNMLCAALA